MKGVVTDRYSEEDAAARKQGVDDHAGPIKGTSIESKCTLPRVYIAISVDERQYSENAEGLMDMVPLDGT